MAYNQVMRRPRQHSPGFVMPKARLREIRDGCDYHRIIAHFGIQVDERRSRPTQLFCLDPTTGEETASLHINLAEGSWHSFSSQTGGGPLELIQAILKSLGQSPNIYEVGQYAVDHGFTSAMPDPRIAAAPPAGRSEKENKVAENSPIRQNLIPAFTRDHPVFLAELERRGISRATADYLGFGYLEASKSPLAVRIVFQVRGVCQMGDGLKPTILTHLGRAMTPDQEATDGKYWSYPWTKTLELYNLDRLLLDPEAEAQTRATGWVVLTEGCFDVAKLVEAGIKNAVASFGAHLDEGQIPRLHIIAEKLGVSRVLVAYDRDQAGARGAANALALLQREGFEGVAFDWEQRFRSPARDHIPIPGEIQDLGDFSPAQLRWLRQHGKI